MSYDLKAFEANKAALFKNTETLPSLVCRRRYVDAMLTQRELNANTTEFAKRISPEDKVRLARDRLYQLKLCVLNGKDDPSVPYLYNPTH